MASITLQIADAVKDLLNNAPAETFALEFTAVRKIRPIADNDYSADVAVIVTPGAIAFDSSVRVADSNIHTVAIYVAQELGTDPETEAADPMELAEQIAEYLARKDAHDAANLPPVEMIPYDATAFREGAFCAVVRAKYRRFTS